MCGIAGVFNFKNPEPVNAAILTRMCSAIAHRGPDDQGLFIDNQARVGLGHRRLSIIDLGGGHQPMSNARRDIHIVFNGEIYNYQELKKELQARGCAFKTNSDTEVIIYLYEQYGADSFARLNGIFAFAIYDWNKRQIILARDHFGVKPLYYWLHQGRLAFSSEIKAILQAPGVEKELDLEQLDSFMSLRYSPSPATLFKNIHKLYPGHFLKVDANGKSELKNFAARPLQVNRHISFEAAQEEYRRLLSAAVKRQIISDVPVGLFLSGGVDSAVLGYLMRQHYKGQIKSFTIGFEGEGDYNELADAAKTAKFIGSEHFEMKISREEYLDYFFRSFTTVEEPIAQTTIPALYYVASLAAKNLKVVLAGQGADEPMAGYARYLGVEWISRYGGLLRSLPLNALKQFLPRNERIKRAIYVSGFRSDIDRIQATYTIFSDDQKEKLYNSTMKGHMVSKRGVCFQWLYDQTPAAADLLSKILFIDTRMGLSDNLLLFNDKVTMANSLEMRVPFLDLELVNFLESLPSSFKLKGLQQKYIHKEAVKEWLPQEIIFRKKRGFQTPMDQWLQSDLGSVVKGLVNESSSACRKFFDVNYINAMVDAHQARKENYQQQIFLLLSFELWYRTFFLNGRTQKK